MPLSLLAALGNKVGLCAKLGDLVVTNISGRRLFVYSSLDYDMSDKFFFKGRQDARENHVKFGYQTKPINKAGSKRYPLTLVVTNETRKQEVEALVADAQLYAVVSIDSSEDSVESITELTTLLSKKGTVKQDEVPGRNEPCVCGSGKKYKKCCG